MLKRSRVPSPPPLATSSDPSGFVDDFPTAKRSRTIAPNTWDGGSYRQTTAQYAGSWHDEIEESGGESSEEFEDADEPPSLEKFAGEKGGLSPAITSTYASMNALLRDLNQERQSSQYRYLTNSRDTRVQLLPSFASAESQKPEDEHSSLSRSSGRYSPPIWPHLPEHQGQRISGPSHSAKEADLSNLGHQWKTPLFPRLPLHRENDDDALHKTSWPVDDKSIKPLLSNQTQEEKEAVKVRYEEINRWVEIHDLKTAEGSMPV